MSISDTRTGEYIDLVRLTELLPGYNCRDCEYAKCEELAEALAEKRTTIESCRFMLQERYRDNRESIVRLLESGLAYKKTDRLVGVLDGYVADFALKPLPDECSCREILYPFYQKGYAAGDLVRYRPMGCPIPHFARIFDADKGLITVHLIGPCHRIENTEDSSFEDIGVCMVGGFIGIVEGKLPYVGETVRFLPKGCMMQKVHSGIVVQLEGNRAVIEGIDLKVWSLPESVR